MVLVRGTAFSKPIAAASFLKGFGRTWWTPFSIYVLLIPLIMLRKPGVPSIASHIFLELLVNDASESGMCIIASNHANLTNTMQIFMQCRKNFIEYVLLG